MSGPRKQKFTTDRAPIEGMRDLGSLSSDYLRLRADPLRDCPDPMLYMLAGVIDGSATPDQQLQAGHYLACLTKHLPPEALAQTMAFITKMRMNLEAPAHRNAHAVAACYRFITEAGRAPSRAELKKYMVARPERYPGLPAEDDKKGWTRLWKDAGLATLPAG